MSQPVQQPTHHCATCGEPVDPLRAARVRFIAEQFCYFCSGECAEEFPAESFETRQEVTPRTPVTGASGEPEAHSRPSENQQPLAAAEANDGELNLGTTGSFVVRTGEGPAQAPLSSAGSRGVETLEPRASLEPTRLGFFRFGLTQEQARLLWLRAAVTTSLLSLILLLAVEAPLTLFTRGALAGLGGLLFVAASWSSYRQQRDPHALLDAAVVSFALGMTVFVLAASDPTAPSWVAFLATTIGALGSIVLLLERHGQRVEREREANRAQMDRTALRIRGDQSSPVPISDLRPGEDIVIHAGETVVADVTVVAGRAEVFAWLGGSVIRTVYPGDFVYAGAKLASGQLRATVRWTGLDRHWLRLTNDPARRADRHAPSVLLARKLSYRGAALAGALAVVAGVVQHLPPSILLLQGLAAVSALLNPAIRRLPALVAAGTALETLRHGIVLRSAEVMEAAGRVWLAVFCARGTLLLGEPELSTLEPLGSLDSKQVLSLVAGAEQAAEHPIAVAVLRAARARGVVPDAVRSPRALAGLGVTAVAANGKPLVVGSRALMLQQRISVARAEERITELEATGRTVLLVALGNHLVGILAFQDGLRAGARAAVQHLLDVGIEPVLLSGDGRETCESLGRTLDIDHVRPEVLPTERGAEVERLCSGGATVAVVGRSPVDEIALASATVSIALPSPGSQSSNFDIELASDEVQKAAVALRLLHRYRRHSQQALALVLGGGTASALAVLSLSAPPALIPVLYLGWTAVGAALISGKAGSARRNA